jgi:predicted GIY-YIG superfamily endonuclease
MYSIYKIWKNDLCYVGITTDFPRRIRDHKRNCLNQVRKGHNLKIYQAIRVDGWDAWTKEVVETTDDKTRERYWVEQIGNLNINIPTRLETHKQWKERNKEGLIYREEKFTCECGGHYNYKRKREHFKTNKHLTYINTNV